MKLHLKLTLAASLVLFLLSGCVAGNQQILKAENQLKLRSIQSRSFDTSDKETMLRTIMATLQDLGFIIDKADMDLGSVSATKLQGYNLRMTVTATPKGETQILVRANAQYNIHPVEDPEPYQHFFESLSKAMFLEAHEVE